MPTFDRLLKAPVLAVICRKVTPLCTSPHARKRLMVDREVIMTEASWKAVVSSFTPVHLWDSSLAPQATTMNPSTAATAVTGPWNSLQIEQPECGALLAALFRDEPPVLHLW